MFSLYVGMSTYSCRKANDCIVECINIPSRFIYELRNMSSEWFPVLQNDGNCYLHNKITGENI
jgi:hypothetical protein